MKTVRVIENYWSWLLCSLCNISAFTFYNYIFLGCCRDREKVLRHEVVHIHQYRSIRFFLIKYFWETIKKGYWNNKFEIKAREYSEKNDT